MTSMRSMRFRQSKPRATTSQHIDSVMMLPGAIYDLVWQRNDPEVEELNSRPQHEVRFERWEVHILELPRYRSSSAALGDRHEGEEAGKSWFADQSRKTTTEAGISYQEGRR